MLIAFSMPAMAVAASGASWLTADDGAACVDGKPGRRARLNAPSTFSLTLAADDAFVPRVLAVLGIKGVSEGTAVVATTGSGDALGGNTDAGVVFRFADGTLGAWMVTAGMVSTTDVMFTISGGGVIDIGELVAMPAVEIDIEPNWVVDDIDPTESRRTLASQVSSVRRQAYRRFEAALSADAVAKVRAGGLANGADWGIVRAALLGDRRGAVIPRWKHPDGGIDAAELNRTAIYGIGRLAKVRHLGGDQYGSDIAFEEVPAIP